MIIENDSELEAALEDITLHVVEYVAQKTIGLIDKKFRVHVYGAGTPKRYHRRDIAERGTLAGWSFKTNRAGAKTFQTEVSEDLSRVDYDPAVYFHGSNIPLKNGSIIQDAREFMTEWIVEGKSGPLFRSGFWRRKRNFWSPVISELDRNFINARVKEALKMKGVRFRI